MNEYIAYAVYTLVMVGAIGLVVWRSYAIWKNWKK